MKALTYHGPHHVSVDNMPDPALEAADDIILRVTATAICVPICICTAERSPARTMVIFSAMNFMGEVVEAGSEVTAVRKGDRVVIPFVIACGDCFFCRLQQYAACESTNSGQGATLNRKGISPPAALFGYSDLYGGIPGGQAEYVRVPKANTGPFKVPDTLPDEKGAVSVRYSAHRLAGG
ncbi:zinc-type alcohol dehydrogenase-like protein ybdR [Klebsiella pneumoniae]|uniref:Zinc-type alcohol dehydrogenase-like protein ybdR n=1 Tax=Klebsiella pneumoniae TaxID=573 RepID=A0A377TQ49_KLEPN|nr:zinc-type alcohol dehydrogenase-like protein ybdR [Klebsiella pneumoniae]